MTQPLTILGLCGSLRKRSTNLSTLHAAGELMPEAMTLTIAPLDEIPLYSQDVQDAGFPAPVTRLRDALAAADGVLIASPEYNFSVSGVLKNAIDWLSRTQPQPFRMKPVAIFSVTAGPVGGARNQYDLRKILGCLDAMVLGKPEIFIGASGSKFDAEGRLTDEIARKLLRDQMGAFADWIARAKRFAA
ncbi:MAG: NAD(P)H-dependent oxidoreductase [Burkholderiales bacterium]|nr:NAD(P)H-dependent oxidoreductase [Burkholderiales bacterium]